jgi:hypothetical protein
MSADQIQADFNMHLPGHRHDSIVAYIRNVLPHELGFCVMLQARPRTPT